MPLDPSIVGRTYPATAPHLVAEERVREFAAALGSSYDGGPAPATFPIVLAFEAMGTFLEAERLPLHRIVHGEQRFAYERPVVPGDVLTTALTVTSVRSIGGADLVATRSEVHDADGALVLTASATLVHRGPEEGEDA